jgi:hypothetical protein
MKTLIGIFLLIGVAFGSLAQDRGIGIRIGAPMGITYKKYLPRNKAVEFGLGTLTNGWYNNYYHRSFRDFDRFEGYEYIDHRVRSAVYLQGRYLLQNDIQIEGMMGKLEWYWGVGAVAKFASVEYRYRPTGTPGASAALYDTRADFDFGPEGIIGMEYTFEDVPLTIFGEFSLMVEIVDRPGIPRGLSGVGVRYNF